jgi:hypothetical protein
VRPVLELLRSTRYDDAMPRWTSLLRVLPLSVWFLTGCTTMQRDFNWVRAELTKPPADEDTHNYGAFIILSLEAPLPLKHSNRPWSKFSSSSVLRAHSLGWEH